MIRRSFLSFLPAGLLSLFGVRRKPTYDPFVAGRGANGYCLARAYRLNPADGHWWEIGRGEVRPGDRIIQLGLDGRRLWKAEALTAHGLHFRDGVAAGVTFTDFDSVVDLMAPPGPKVWQGVATEADG